MLNSDNKRAEIKREKYRTLKKSANASFEVKKSLFIGHAAPFKDEKGASEFIRKIKAKYSDATHNVFAYILNGGQIAKYSDAGEPQGTAGIPILDVLKKSDLIDSCIVVTRYFGGTMLGAGGLIRAYTEAAKIAVDAAGIADFEHYTVVKLAVSYSDYQKILPALSRAEVIVDNTEFLSSVGVVAAIKSDFVGEFLPLLSELSAGRITYEKIGSRYSSAK